ncbi:predicted protein [Cyanophage P-SSP2]|uniref:Uncharacterized protein n=1 Tax=Cyanophage P-SSP2 TaxID=444876 RepID=E3SQJ8_9CAUD|nr:hypothetical protein CYLG_00013 [Cyanophage P-SSP2]ADP00216.1 predicted protein [Cyanophage P-SSP2]
MTSLDKRSVELQVRRETGDGDHESEDLSEDTGENIRQVVHKSANRYTLVSLDTSWSLVLGVWCISTTHQERCKSVTSTWIFISKL